MDIKNILYPTDFSEGSSFALEYAVDLAKRYGAKLYLFNVIYDMAKGAGWYVPHVSMDELYKDIEKVAKKELDRFGNEEVRGLKNVERVTVTGVPHDEIIKFVKKTKIDLIVMGSHGKKGMDRILFGSTAANVVRFAPCPVLTVRIPKHQA
jgi:nucleotide-binding universal stress UspA family protein